MPDKLPQWGAVYPVREAWSCALVPQSGRLHAAGMETGNRLAKSPHTLGALHMQVLAIMWILIMQAMLVALAIGTGRDLALALSPTIFVVGLIGLSLVMHAIGAAWRWLRRSGSTFEH